MAGLQAKIEINEGMGDWADMAARFSNGTGTPLVTGSCFANASGEAIAGVYDLTFEDVVPGVSATVKVTANSPTNPYNDSVGQTVALDGTTEHTLVVGGVALVFSSSGSFLGTWTAQVRIGLDFGTLDAFLPDAGTPSDSRQIQVENTGAADAQDCKARVLPVVKYFRKNPGEIVFLSVKPFAEGATEKLSGGGVAPYEATVLNVSGSGPSKTMDLKIDGALVNVTNVDTGASGTSAGLNVTDLYRITSGDLADVEFMLSEEAAEDDAANLLVFGTRFLQIAPDVGGGPGAFGTSDVDLTESGQSTGVITAGGVAYYHERVLVPDGGNSKSNPYPVDVALEGRVSEAAGWDA